ncbi:hypothetical protein [Porphyromonas gingivalis]|uniref:HlyD family secretion protein n=2 Tax=Porphyromonas gingivalis TaxID=837 RepID=A0AAE9X7T4_PORGN|nr:hypothetical protein [Porphyromonas gingivalis]WCF99614.1 hypothetical protein NY149_02975 [Porphyromonas gingivalis]SJL20175.1 hypothetical protein PGIN_3-3_01257 [Porphyromonas gingivalis]
MEEEKRQERSFELRSEKVRSIVGQIPSSLVRYGITAIGVVLLCIVAVAYFLPYKQVYSGTAVIHEIGSEQKAVSTEINVLLKFGEKRPNILIEGASIEFQSAVEVAKGNILSLSMERDTLGRQEALCRVPLQPMRKMEHSEVDFILTLQSGNLLSRFFSEFTGE